MKEAPKKDGVSSLAKGASTIGGSRERVKVQLIKSDGTSESQVVRSEQWNKHVPLTRRMFVPKKDPKREKVRRDDVRSDADSGSGRN